MGMNTTDAQIVAAFELARPSMTARMVEIVESTVARVAAHHPGDIQRGTHCWMCKPYMGTVWRTTSKEDPTSYNPSQNLVVDAGRVAVYVAKIVDAAVVAFVAKVHAKTEGMTDVIVQHTTGTEFQVTGRKGTHDVKIDQQMIVNFSSKGRPFNQYPARVYIDGMKSSEKALKTL